VIKQTDENPQQFWTQQFAPTRLNNIVIFFKNLVRLV